MPADRAAVSQEAVLASDCVLLAMPQIAYYSSASNCKVDFLYPIFEAKV